MLICAAVYFGNVVGGTLFWVAVLFAGYGVHAAATDGIAKAWICSTVSRTETASVMGAYAGL